MADYDTTEPLQFHAKELLSFTMAIVSIVFNVQSGFPILKKFGKTEKI